MARILYGINGVGLGHAIRSSVVLDYLSKEHEIFILTSNRAYSHLNKYYDNTHNIEGVELVFKKNEIVNMPTIFRNVRKVSKKNIDKFNFIKRKIDKFKPQIVISDVEFFSGWYSRKNNIPLISIDNQHYLIFGDYKFPSKYSWQHSKTKMIIELLTKKANYYLITTFLKNKIKEKDNIFCSPPLIRDSVLNAKPSNGDYIFVYQSTKSYEKLFSILKSVNEKFIIYGFDRTSQEGNLTFKRFNEDKEFIDDLSNSKAVISNGGFTLISEALYLKKPILVIPIKKHFEQVINGLYVKQWNHGEMYDDLTFDRIRSFINKLKEYKKYTTPQKDNKALFK